MNILFKLFYSINHSNLSYYCLYNHHQYFYELQQILEPKMVQQVQVVNEVYKEIY